MNRRQFLRAAALAGPSTAAVPAAGHGPEPGDATGPRTETGTPDTTPTPTASPTPTEPAATPTTGWDPCGHVSVRGASETVLTPDGGTAFVATGDGFAAVDLSDPTSPEVLARETAISPPGADGVMADVFDVKYDDGRLLVAGPANYHPDAVRGVALFDVSDPADPALLGGYRVTFPVHNCYLDGELAYLTGNDGETNPLVVVDVPDATEAGRWSVVDRDERWRDVHLSLRTLHDVYVQDGYAYLAYWDAGTWILDVSDPADPAYVADIRERSVADLAKLDGLRAARESSEPPGNDHYVAPDPAGNLLAVGKESWNSNFGKEGTTPGPDDPGGPSGVALYDISDPADPVHRATIDPPPTADPNVNGVWTTAHNFELAAGRLYSSWYRGGVKVHDVSDPANPVELRRFRRSSTTSFWTAQAAVPGETVVATSHENPADPEDSGTVYAFPDAPLETPTPTATSTTAPASTDSTDRSGTTQRPPTPTATTGSDTAADGPGFGPLAALAGLGLGAWRLVGDRGSNDERGEEEE